MRVSPAHQQLVGPLGDLDLIGAQDSCPN